MTNSIVKKRVYVGGLGDKIGNDEVKELFLPYVKNYLDFQLALGHKNKSRGFGFLTIDISEESWEKCLNNLNGLQKNGCTLKVQESSVPQNKSEPTKAAQSDQTVNSDSKQDNQVTKDKSIKVDHIINDIKIPEKDQNKRQKIIFNDEGEVEQVDELPSNKLDVNSTTKDQLEISLNNKEIYTPTSGPNSIGLEKPSVVVKPVKKSKLTANEKRLEAMKRKDEEFKKQSALLLNTNNTQNKKSHMVFGDDGELIEVPHPINEVNNKKSKNQKSKDSGHKKSDDATKNESYNDIPATNNDLVLTDQLHSIFSDQKRAFGGFSFFDPPTDDEADNQQVETAPINNTQTTSDFVIGASLDASRSHDRYFFFHFNTPKFMSERFEGDKLFCRTKTNEEYIQSLEESRGKILSEAKGRHKRVIRQKLSNKQKNRRTQ